jgi:hypothetical protein
VLARAVLGLLVTATLVPAAAEEILRPRDKGAFEAELKALQEKYGTAPSSVSSTEVEAAAEPAAASGQASVVAEVSVVEAAESAQAVGPASLRAPAAGTRTAGEGASSTAGGEPAPMFPGTLLKPRGKVDAAAAGTAGSVTASTATDAPVGPTDAVAATPAGTAAGASTATPAERTLEFSGTLITPRKADAVRQPAAQSGSASAASTPARSEPDADPAEPTLEFSGTMISPRKGDAARQQPPAARTPSTTASAPSVPAAQPLLPMRRLSDPDPTRRQADDQAGVPALRIALLPVGERQFMLREQIYDAESLEIYLLQLKQPIDSIVLLSEPGQRIELGHLVALGELGRAMRVPTLYEQGGNLRALSVR